MEGLSEVPVAEDHLGEAEQGGIEVGSDGSDLFVEDVSGIGARGGEVILSDLHTSLGE